MKWFLCLMAQLIWQESDLPVTPWTVNMPCSLEGLKVTELKNSHPGTTANLFCLLLTEQRPGPPAARLTLWEQKASPALSRGRARVWCLGCGKSLRPPGGESRLAALLHPIKAGPAHPTPLRPAASPQLHPHQLPQLRTSARRGRLSAHFRPKVRRGFWGGKAFPVCLITMHPVRLWDRWSDETTGGPGSGAVGGTKAVGAAKLASPLDDYREIVRRAWLPCGLIPGAGCWADKARSELS